jgi:hypothetical protein
MGGLLPADHPRRCTATARSGERCRRAAIPGGNVCASHGGSARQVRAAAARRVAAERVESVAREVLGTPSINVDPADAMLAALQDAAGMLSIFQAAAAPLRLPGSDLGASDPWRTDGVIGVDHLGDGAPHVLVTLIGTWTDRVVSIASACRKAGVDERRVQMSEDRGRELVRCLRAAADAQTAAVVAMFADHPELAARIQAWATTELPSVVAGAIRQALSEHPEAISVESKARP